MIAFDHVTKTYGKKTVLADATFTAEPGEWVTILGRSGEGTSAIARLLLRAEDPASGKIEIDGVALSSLPVALLQVYRSRVGVAFQEPTFLEHATVEENVALPLDLQGMSPQKILKLVAPLLQRCGIGGKAYAFPSELSRAEKTMACVARAVIHSPSIVIADEALDGLDAGQRRVVLDLLKERHAAGATVIALTRDARDAAELGGRLLTLSGGRISSSSATPASASPVATAPKAPPAAARPKPAEEAQQAPAPAAAEEASSAGRKIKITAIHS